MPARRLRARPSARDALRQVSRAELQTVAQALRALCEDPDSAGSEPLGNPESSYRVIRVARFLIAYSETEDSILIEVVGDRAEVYRHLGIDPPTDIDPSRET